MYTREMIRLGHCYYADYVQLKQRESRGEERWLSALGQEAIDHFIEFITKPVYHIFSYYSYKPELQYKVAMFLNRVLSYTMEQTDLLSECRITMASTFQMVNALANVNCSDEAWVRAKKLLEKGGRPFGEYAIETEQVYREFAASTSIQCITELTSRMINDLDIKPQSKRDLWFSSGYEIFLDTLESLESLILESRAKKRAREDLPSIISSVEGGEKEQRNEERHGNAAAREGTTRGEVEKDNLCEPPLKILRVK